MVANTSPGQTEVVVFRDKRSHAYLFEEQFCTGGQHIGVVQQCKIMGTIFHEHHGIKADLAARKDSLLKRVEGHTACYARLARAVRSVGSGVKL